MSTPFEELINKYGLVGENVPTSLATGIPIPNVPQEFQEPISRASAKYGIPPEHLAALAEQESRFNPNALGEVLPSGERAKGPWQFIPSTASRMGLTNPFDIEQSADAAARLYKENLQAVAGEPERALAAHFAGAGGAVGTLTPKTQTYLEQVKNRIPKFTTPSVSAGEPDAFTSLVNKYGLTETQPVSGFDINKYAGLFPETPQAIPTEEPIGLLGAVPKGIYSSFTRRLPEMLGQAGEFVGVPGAEGLKEWARKGEVKPEFTGNLAEWLYKGGEMIAPSVAVPMAIGATGLGAIPAAIGAGALYGLSQAQQTVETAKEAGMEAPRWAPWATGGIEAIGETLGTIALQRLFGPLAPVIAKSGKVTIGNITRPAFTRTMKEFFGVTIPTEVGTEIAQQLGEAGVEEAAGIRKPEYLKEAGSVIGPTVALSAMTLGLGRGAYRLQAKNFENSLSNPQVPENVRAETVNQMAKTLMEADPKIGTAFQTRAMEAIANKEPIPLDRDVMEWVNTPPQAPEETKTGESTTGQAGLGVAETKPATTPETPMEGVVKPSFEAPLKETANELRYTLREPAEMNPNAFGEGKQWDTSWTSKKLESTNIPKQYNNPNDRPIFQALKGNPKENIEPLVQEGMRVVLSRDAKNNLVVQGIVFNKKIWTPERINEWYAKNKDRVEQVSQGQVQKPELSPLRQKRQVSPSEAQPAPETTEDIYNKLLTYYKGDERALRGAQITPTILSEAKVTTKPIDISTDLMLGERGIKFINPNYVPAKKETITTPTEVGKTEEEVPFGADLEKLAKEAKKEGLPEPKARPIERTPEELYSQPVRDIATRLLQTETLEQQNALLDEAQALRDSGQVDDEQVRHNLYNGTSGNIGELMKKGWTGEEIDAKFASLNKSIKDRFGSPIKPPETPWGKEGRGRIANQQPIWYNPLRTAIENRIPHEQPIKASNFALALKKEPGIKSEFVKWSGVEDFLNSKEKFTKQEVLDYLDAHVRPFEEVYYAESQKLKDLYAEHEAANSLIDRTSDRKKLEELNIARSKIEDEVAELRKENLGKPEFTAYQLPGPKTNEKEFFVTYPNERSFGGGTVRFPLWKDPHSAYSAVNNGVVRLRWNDRIIPDGKKIRFLEEAQQGFKDDDPNVPQIIKDNWYKIGIRRFLKAAAEDGVDGVGMTTGKQQAERYDLRKYVDKVRAIIDRPGYADLEVTYKGPERYVHSEHNIPFNKLEDYVGKKLARKIATEQKNQIETYSDLDLEIGGEGLARLYDETLKNTFNDIGKKFLTKMELKDIGIRERKPGYEEHERDLFKQVYVMPLNDRLRDSVVNKPIPMLRPATEYGLNPTVSAEQAISLVNLFRGLVGQLSRFKLTPEMLVKTEGLESSIRDWMKGNLNTPIPEKIWLGGLTEYGWTGQKLRAMVTVALSARGQPLSYEEIEKAVVHEAGHVIEDTILSEKERRMARETIPNTEERMEALVDAYLKMKTPPKGMEAIFTKIVDFFTKVQNWLQGNGFDSIDSLFTRIVQGKYAQKEIETANPKSGVMPMPEGVQSWGEMARDNWHYGNPSGIAQARIAEDEPPKNPYSSVSDFKDLRGKGYEKGWLSRLERWYMNPFWMAKKHPDGSRVLESEMRGQENTQQIRLGLTGDPDLKPGEPWKIHPFFALPFQSGEKVLKAALDSTVANKVKEEEELRGEKYGLNDAEVNAYFAIKKTFDKAYRKVQEVLEWTTFKPYENKSWINELKAVTKGVPQFNEDGSPKVDNFGEQIFVKTPLLDVTRNMDPDDTKEFLRAYNYLKPFQKKLSDYRTEMGKVNYYFPLVHGEGEYVARVWKGEGPKAVLIDSYRSRKESEAITNMEMLKDKYKDNKDYHFEAAIVKRQPESFYQSISDVHTEKFVEQAINKARVRELLNEKEVMALQDAILDTLADDLKARGFGRHMITRLHPEPGSAVGGYQTEQGQKLMWDYLSGISGYVTKIPKAYEFYDALKDIDVKKAPERFDYWATYIKDMLRNSEPVDRISGRARSIAFAYYLAASLKAGAVQATQNFVTGIPFLARHMKEMGVKGLAEAKYMKAMVDAATGKITDEERIALQQVIEKGETADQFIREATGRVTNKYGSLYDNMVKMFAIPFSGMEILNRKSAFIAMFRTAKESGLSNEEAISKGIDFIHETHYLMGKSNLPEWARQKGLGGAGLRTAYTFRSFNHNYVLSMLHSLAKGSDGKRHFDVLARSLAYITLMGGALAIPFLDDILDDMERITGTPYRSQMKKSLRGVGGDMLEQFGTAGIPAALAGVDISGSLKMGSPTKLLTGIWQDQQAPSPISESVYGVWGGLFQKGQYTLNSYMNADYQRMMENISPVGLENILKAWRLSEEPVTSRKGKIQFTETGEPLKLTGGELGAQLIGFRPSRIAEVSREKRTQANVEARFTDKRNRIADMIRLAKSQKDWDRIRDKIMSYNQDAAQFQGAVPMVTNESIKHALTQVPEKKWLIFERMMGR